MWCGGEKKFSDLVSGQWLVVSEEEASPAHPLTTNHYPLTTKNLEENLSS